MQIHVCTEADSLRWTEYVSQNAQATGYHRWPWRHVLESVFNWRTFYLIAEQNGRVCGLLPLVWQKSFLGSYLSSMPHLKGGGILADDPECQEQLLQRAIAIAKETKASYLELRHATEHHLGLSARTDKVSASLPVSPDSEAMLRALHKKTRNLVRKSMTFGLTAEFGGPELLDDFHSVYCRNMRDLGSPAYSRRFFSAILESFSGDTHICVVRHEGQTVAAAWLMGFRNTIEVPWASAWRKYHALKPNMFLYWNLLVFAGNHGFEWFDFGRSTVGSGAFEFKLQWGAEPTTLHWEYWLPDGACLPSSHRSLSMRLISRLWQKLPLAVTNTAGPKLIPLLPGI